MQFSALFGLLSASSDLLQVGVVFFYGVVCLSRVGDDVSVGAGCGARQNMCSQTMKSNFNFNYVSVRGSRDGGAGGGGGKAGGSRVAVQHKSQNVKH